MNDDVARPAVHSQVETWYRLDRNDRIVSVGGLWDSVARENGGEALAGGAVVGTGIYDHISGHFTRKFLKDFIARARTSGVASRQAYRCDAPHAKRLMEMRAELHDPELVQVTHFLVEEALLPYPIVTVEGNRRGGRGKLRCSYCNRLRNQIDGHWVWLEPEDCVEPGVVTNVIHTVCLNCRKGISARERWVNTPLLLARGKPTSVDS